MGEVRNKAYIVDLESIVDIDRNVWLIDINNPSEYIVKVSEVEFNLIKSGIYKNQDNLVNFNDSDYYLPNYLNDKLKYVLKKRKDLTYNDMTFSFREYLNEEHIGNIKVREDIIKMFKNEDVDIYCIVSTLTKENGSKILKKVDEKLENIAQTIKKYYIINKTFNNSHEDDTITKKSYTILKNIIGLNIRDDKFIPEINERYKNVEYFTNDLYSLNGIKTDIQLIFEQLYFNTKDKDVQTRIDGLNYPLNIRLNLITNNKANLLKKYVLNLNKVRKVMLFESFKSYLKP